MKYRVLITFLIFVLIGSTYGQKPTITLTFTANNNNQHVPLNSIFIENLSRGCDTTLFAPDTMLVLNYVLDIGDNEIKDVSKFSISQNYPNPMEGKTIISLYLPEKNDIRIMVNNVMGRQLIYKEYRLEHGQHTFTFYSGDESLYFFTAMMGQQSRTIKMFNSPSTVSTSEICKLEYPGSQACFEGYKARNNLNNFDFKLGDLLKFTASSDLGEQVITSTPTGDQIYYFNYTNQPCAGTSTITDIEGNTYNTVQIGDQCWMKENLKTTTYKNGTPIPQVTDSIEWAETSIGAYTWYDNESSWKDKYGALYNWFTVVDPNGLCPEGWHVPTQDEWTALLTFIGGGVEPHGDELKSCRQVNSPLGGNCNTSEHPRWDDYLYDENYGTNIYGFSGLPGGFPRFYGFIPLHWCRRAMGVFHGDLFRLCLALHPVIPQRRRGHSEPQ